MRLETKEEAHQRVERMKSKGQKPLCISNLEAWTIVAIVTIGFWMIITTTYIRS
jgi:hypothetical protein